MLLAQNVEQQRGYRVITEVEVFQMYAALSITDILEHQVELILARHDESHIIMLVEVNAQIPHLTH